MVKTVDEICQAIRNIGMQDTGNVIETILTYQVKQRQVMLIMEKTPSGKSQRYKIVMLDLEVGDHSETEILFTEYPSRYIDHSAIIGNNGNRVYRANSGVQKSVRDIQKALAKVYNVGVGKQHM